MPRHRFHIQTELMMGIYLLGIGSILKSIYTTLIGLGWVGILGIAFLDAAFIPMPGGPDLVVMALTHNNHSMMPVYVIAAVIGSTLGCLVPYWIGRKAGEAALRVFSEEKRARVSGLVYGRCWPALFCRRPFRSRCCSSRPGYSA
jgi:membrane protein YqaA with SNARE-associated domain